MILIAVLALVVVFGVLAGVFLTRLQRAKDRVDSLRLDGELIQIRRHIDSRIDCSRIPDTLTCKIGGVHLNSCGLSNMPLFDHDGKKIVDGTPAGSEIAPGIRLRACCDAGSLRVEAKRTTQSGSLKMDPFTSTRAYNWRDIYEVESSPCDFYDTDGETLKVPDGVAIAKGPAIPTGVVLGVLFATPFNCPAYSGDEGGDPEIMIEALGKATCPTGFKAVSGGAACETMTILPLYPSFAHLHPGSFQKGSGPTADGNSWQSSCCVAVNAVPTLFWPGKVTSVCLRQ